MAAKSSQTFGIGTAVLLVLAIFRLSACAEECQILKGPNSAIDALEYSPDGNSLISLTGREAVIWSASAKRASGVISLPASPGRRSVSWHPDGKWFAVWGDFPGVRLCQVGTNRVKTVLEGGPVARESSSVCFSPDGKLLARASWGGSSRSRSELTPNGTLPGVVDLLDLRSMEVVPLESDQGISCVRFSLDGARLFGAGMSGRIAAWNPVSRQRVRTVQAADAMLHSLDLSGDGSLLAAGPATGDAILLDAKTLKKRSSLKDPSGRENRSAVNAVAFTPDGRRLVQASLDGMIKLWDVVQSELVAAASVEHGVRALSLSPLGETLLVVDREGSLTAFDSSSLRRMGSIPGASAFAFARQGDVLATGSLVEGQIVLHTLPLEFSNAARGIRPAAQAESGRLKSRR